jgi:hypothetical protein
VRVNVVGFACDSGFTLVDLVECVPHGLLYCFVVGVQDEALLDVVFALRTLVRIHQTEVSYLARGQNTDFWAGGVAN